MKTFLFDTINRYKRFSESLDAQTILCNKTWWVFNDSGEKEVYIFQENGTLIISMNGKVTNAAWQYIPANKSIIISGNNQSYMVHPAYKDDVIMALQVDGTQECAFLIDETNKQHFSKNSYTDVLNYFVANELSSIKLKERERLEDEKAHETIVQQRDKKIFEYEQILRGYNKCDEFKKMAEKECGRLEKFHIGFMNSVLLGILLMFVSFIVCKYNLFLIDNYNVQAIIAICSFIFPICISIFFNKIIKWRTKEHYKGHVKEWVNKHSQNPICKWVKHYNQEIFGYENKNHSVVNPYYIDKQLHIMYSAQTKG